MTAYIQSFTDYVDQIPSYIAHPLTAGVTGAIASSLCSGFSFYAVIVGGVVGATAYLIQTFAKPFFNAFVPIQQSLPPFCKVLIHVFTYIPLTYLFMIVFLPIAVNANFMAIAFTVHLSTFYKSR